MEQQDPESFEPARRTIKHVSDAIVWGSFALLLVIAILIQHPLSRRIGGWATLILFVVVNGAFLFFQSKSWEVEGALLERYCRTHGGHNPVPFGNSGRFSHCARCGCTLEYGKPL